MTLNQVIISKMSKILRESSGRYDLDRFLTSEIKAVRILAGKVVSGCMFPDRLLESLKRSTRQDGNFLKNSLLNGDRSSTAYKTKLKAFREKQEFLDLFHKLKNSAVQIIEKERKDSARFNQWLQERKIDIGLLNEVELSAVMQQAVSELRPEMFRVPSLTELKVLLTKNGVECRQMTNVQIIHEAMRIFGELEHTNLES